MSREVDGVGRFSVLTQVTSDSNTDINVGYREISGTKGNNNNKFTNIIFILKYFI